MKVVNLQNQENYQIEYICDLHRKQATIKWNF
jgi:hypothetical protein